MTSLSQNTAIERPLEDGDVTNRFISETDIILIDNLFRLCGKGDNSPAIFPI